MRWRRAFPPASPPTTARQTAGRPSGSSWPWAGREMCSFWREKAMRLTRRSAQKKFIWTNAKKLLPFSGKMRYNKCLSTPMARRRDGPAGKRERTDVEKRGGAGHGVHCRKKYRRPCGGIYHQCPAGKKPDPSPAPAEGRPIHQGGRTHLAHGEAGDPHHGWDHVHCGHRHRGPGAEHPGHHGGRADGGGGAPLCRGVRRHRLFG